MMILSTALKYIEDNLFDEIDYNKLARACGTNKYNLMRIFSASTDYTLAEYIRVRRLSRAGEIISSTTKTIIEIAYDCGYGTAESFSKAYKNFHGTTARETRKTKKYRVVPPWQIGEPRVMEYTVEKFSDEKFLGYSAHFEEKPANRGKQDKNFFYATRAEQNALRHFRDGDDCDWWEVLDKFHENGFETTCAVKLSKEFAGNFSKADFFDFTEKTQTERSEVALTGEAHRKLSAFKVVVINGKYARFISASSDFPMETLDRFTKDIYSGIDGYEFVRDELRPELLKIHWCNRKHISERRIEIFIPVK